MNDQAQQQLKQLEGLPLIPVKAVRGDKRPIGEGWEQNPKSHSQIASMNGQIRMVGLLLNDRFTAVDIDGPIVEKWLEENYGVALVLPNTWMVSSGREGRYAGIYQKPSSDQVQRLAAAGVKVSKNISIKTEVSIPDPEHDASGAADKKQGIEVRFNGQQVVLGQHPSPHDLHYCWLNGDPDDVAPLPDVVIDLLIKHHQFVADEKAERRGSRGEKRKGFVNLPEEKAPNEPDWWGWCNGERLTCLAEKWLDKKDGNGYEPWMHVCSLMKASVEQNEIDSAVAVKAFLAFSRRMPGFVDDNDCLNKFEQMDEGSFEDALGLLIEKGKDGGLVLPPRPKTTQQTTKSPVAQMGIAEVEDNLRRAIDQSSDPASMAVLTAELAHASPFSQSAINQIAKRMQEADDAEADRKSRAAALATTAAIEAEFRALRLEEFFPGKLVQALDGARTGMPYSDFSVVFSFLLAASGSVKLGTKVCANKVTNFVVPMNLYAAEAGESGAKKTPKTQRFIKGPTRAVRAYVQEMSDKRISTYNELPNQAKKGITKPVPLYLHVDTFTGEATCERLAEASRMQLPLLLYREELKAVFESFGLYKNGKSGGSGGDEELILELFDGHEHVTIRVGGDRYFPEAHVSLGGAIQQGVLVELLKSQDLNGKWARVLFYPLEKVLMPLPDDSAVSDEEYGQHMKPCDRYLMETINGLFALGPETYFMQKDASAWFRNYEEKSQSAAAAHSEPSLRALKGKSGGKLPRIAGLLMLLEHVEPVPSLDDPEVVNKGFQGLEYRGVRRKIQVKHLEAAAKLVDLSDRWVSSFHESIASGGRGETVAAVGAMEQRIQEIALKLGDWQSWKKIKEGLTPTQRKTNNAERGKDLLRNLADKGLGEVKIGDRGGLQYRALRGEGGTWGE